MSDRTTITINMRYGNPISTLKQTSNPFFFFLNRFVVLFYPKKTRRKICTNVSNFSHRRRDVKYVKRKWV